jgi:hypothetical protein
MLFQMLLLSSLLSGVNFQKTNPANWTVGYLARVIVAFAALSGYAFVVLPPLVGPFFGLMGLLIPAYVGRTAWGLLKVFSTEDDEEKRGNAMRSLVGSGCTLLALSSVTLITSLATSALFNTEHYQKMLGRVGTAELASSKSQHLVPLTTYAMVEEKSDDPVGGDKASVFSVVPSSATAQVVKGSDGALSMIWAVPTDFRGFFEALRFGSTGTMGWVKVNAASPQAPAVMGGSQGFKYTPGAAFGKKLPRYLYWAYPNFELVDYTLEVDDQGKPWWTVTALSPTSGWGAPEVKGVIVVDPVSGFHTFYETARIPSWVDRVYPADLLHDRISWAYGLKNGYFRTGNDLGLKRPVAPSGGDMDLTVSAQGEFFGWTGLTSTNSSDNAVTSQIRISYRTGKASEVTLPTASAPDESKIGARMVAALKDKPGLEVGSPALYDVDGSPAYIAVVTAGSVYRGVIVYHYNAQIFGYDQDGLDGALTRYRLALTQNPTSGVASGSGTSVTARFKVSRVGNVTTAGESTIYLVAADGKAYVLQVNRLDQSQQVQAAVTKPEDTVEIQGAALGTNQVFVTKIKNTSVPQR